LIILPTMCVLIVSAFFLCEGGTSVMYLRTIFKYVNLFLVPYVTLLYVNEFSVRLFVLSVWIWGTVVIGQALSGNILVGFLLPRESILFGRNFALGFAPEPAYMAKVAVLFLLLTDYFALEAKLSRLSTLLLRVMCVIMIFLSASLTGFLLLIAYVLIALFLRKKSVLRGLILAITILLVFLAVMLFEEEIANFVLEFSSKLGKLGDNIRALIEYKTLLPLLLDPSFQARFGGFLSNVQVIKSGHIFGLGVPSYPTGSIFAPVFDSGIIGLIFVVTILWSFTSNMMHLKQEVLRKYTLALLIMFSLFTFSESLATSYIGFFLGLNFYMTRLDRAGLVKA